MVLTAYRTEKTIKHSPCCITDGLPCLDKWDSHITVWPRTKPTWLMVSYCSGAFPLFSPFTCISRIWSYLPDLRWCCSLTVHFYELIFKSVIGNLGLHTQIILFVCLIFQGTLHIILYRNMWIPARSMAVLILKSRIKQL